MTTGSPTSEVVDGDRLTEQFRAMTPLQKWETLVLSGLIGTDEPWIADMRASLQSLEARIAELEGALRPFAETLVFDPDKIPGERHWCTFGREATRDDVLRAQTALTPSNRDRM